MQVPSSCPLSCLLLTLECRTGKNREQKPEEAVPSLVTGQILAIGERKASEKSQAPLGQEGDSRPVKEALRRGEKPFFELGREDNC